MKNILRESITSVIEARGVKAVKYTYKNSTRDELFCIKGGMKTIANFIERVAKRVDPGFEIEKVDNKRVVVTKETDLGKVSIYYEAHPKYPRYEIRFVNAERSSTETNKVFDVLKKTGYGRGVGIGYYTIDYEDFHKDIDENSTEADLEKALYTVLEKTVKPYFKSLEKFNQ